MKALLKNIAFTIFLMMLLLPISGCDWFFSASLGHTRWYCCVFKFADESYKDYVITLNDYVGFSVYRDSINYFPSAVSVFDSVGHFERIVDYYFADSTDICSFAKSEKLIELHQGYYMWFPYTSFADPNMENIQLRNLKWDDLCLSNAIYYADSIMTSTYTYFYPDVKFWLKISDDVEIIADYPEIYSKVCIIDGHTLQKYGHKHPKKMTLKDIVKSCNKAIDNGFCEIRDNNVLQVLYE